MPRDEAAGMAAMKRLEPLVGEWSVEASFPGEWSIDSSVPPDAVGRMTIEWTLGGQFLLQRTEIPVPGAPDGLCLIAYDLDRATFTQHYFDSRGVVRIYAMEFGDGCWNLQRDEPDFSPLDFHQRWRSTVSAGGDRIEGSWEASDDGSAWKKDFDLTYARVG